MLFVLFSTDATFSTSPTHPQNIEERGAHMSTEDCKICKELGLVQRCQRVKSCQFIGAGTYGQVFFCVGSDETVYVEKIVKTLDKPEGDAKRPKGEGMLLEKCNHPFVVRAMPSHHGPRVIRMEYCQGGDLHRRIQIMKAADKYFVEAEVINLFVQMLLAVQYLHSLVILHRDIKPANFLLETDSGPVKLGDFGSSCADVSVGATMQRTLCGTYTTVAPELLQNQTRDTLKTMYNVKAEVWSLGATLYEIMSLEPPFPLVANGDAVRYLEVMDLVRNGDFQKVSDRNLPFSPELCQLCDSMMNVQPNERPSIRQMLLNNALRPTVDSVVAAFGPTEYGELLKNQWETIQNVKTMDFQTECLRVRGSTNKPVSVRLGRRGTQLLIKEADSDKDKSVNLVSCEIMEDEFEDIDRTYYGVLVTPKGKTSITVGYYDDEAKRDTLLRELQAGKETGM